MKEHQILERIYERATRAREELADAERLARKRDEISESTALALQGVNYYIGFIIEASAHYSKEGRGSA